MLVLNVPASHAVHSIPSDVPLYPTTHLQSINALLPDAELVPSGQSEHSPTPVAALYSPASHAVHASPFDVPFYPTTHSQSVSASLPDAELVPSGHSEHSPTPVVALYSPASHAVHSTPSYVALYPTTHSQSVKSSLPDAELVPAGHVEQFPAPAAEKVPASHASHSLLPSFEKVPAAHGVQLPAADPEKVPSSHGRQLLLPGSEKFPALHRVQFPAPESLE